MNQRNDHDQTRGNIGPGKLFAFGHSRLQALHLMIEPFAGNRDALSGQHADSVERYCIRRMCYTGLHSSPFQYPIGMQYFYVIADVAAAILRMISCGLPWTCVGLAK